MSTERESVLRTMLVAVGVALVCSAMVTSAVHFLRPIQAAYGALERNRAIALAAGVIDADAGDAEVVTAFLDLEAVVLDTTGGGIAADLDGHSYDHWAEAGEGGPRFVPVYLAGKQGAPGLLVVPVDGKGMWSTLYGYLALEADLNTVHRLVIHGHGETPGIGDRIQSPEWLAQWAGKRLRDDAGRLRIQVSADATVADEHRVDVITGATITSQAVGRMVRQRLGPEGYQAALLELAGSFTREGNP